MENIFLKIREIGLYLICITSIFNLNFLKCTCPILLLFFSLSPFPPLVSGRKVIRHSHDILSELPIKFLLQTAERDQDRFGGLYPQLLRLCSTHFPHLCMLQVRKHTLKIKNKFMLKSTSYILPFPS